jgi:hypothetical protein
MRFHHRPAPRLSSSSGVGRHLMAGPEPDGLRAAVFLWSDARAWRDPRTDPVCTRAAQAAGGAERRRGGAVFVRKSSGVARGRSRRRTRARLIGTPKSIRRGVPSQICCSSPAMNGPAPREIPAPAFGATRPPATSQHMKKTSSRAVNRAPAKPSRIAGAFRSLPTAT